MICRGKISLFAFINPKEDLFLRFQFEFRMCAYVVILEKDNTGIFPGFESYFPEIIDRIVIKNDTLVI